MRGLPYECQAGEGVAAELLRDWDADSLSKSSPRCKHFGQISEVLEGEHADGMLVQSSTSGTVTVVQVGHRSVPEFAGQVHSGRQPAPSHGFDNTYLSKNVGDLVTQFLVLTAPLTSLPYAMSVADRHTHHGVNI